MCWNRLHSLQAILFQLFLLESLPAIQVHCKKFVSLHLIRLISYGRNILRGCTHVTSTKIDTKSCGFSKEQFISKIDTFRKLYSFFRKCAHDWCTIPKATNISKLYFLSLFWNSISRVCQVIWSFFSSLPFSKMVSFFRHTGIRGVRKCLKRRLLLIEGIEKI